MTHVAKVIGQVTTTTAATVTDLAAMIIAKITTGQTVTEMGTEMAIRRTVTGMDTGMTTRQIAVTTVARTGTGAAIEMVVGMDTRRTGPTTNTGIATLIAPATQNMKETGKLIMTTKSEKPETNGIGITMMTDVATIAMTPDI